MSVYVISAGMFTNIQDNGRFNYTGFGVPVSGAMDAYAAKFANLLVGNAKEKAVLEIALTGPKLQFLSSALVAISGLGVEVVLNGESVSVNASFLVKEGDVLHLRQVTKGARAYLAVKDGFLTKKVLGSRSFYRGITAQPRLFEGDELMLSDKAGVYKKRTAGIKFAEDRYDTEVLKVTKGPEWAQLSMTVKQQLLQHRFHVSKHNSRQAYQMTEKLKNRLRPILTQPVLPGTVQLTPGGNIIVLMRDAQVTGGYPRVLQLGQAGMNCLAQKKAGDRVLFEL